MLLELPSGKRRVLRVANTKTEIDRFVATLRALKHPCEVAFEPTGDYHRPLVYVLGQAGFRLCMVSSIAVARTREALYNSWDKNDPKDAQVILHLLKNGTTQRYLDPLVTGCLRRSLLIGSLQLCGRDGNDRSRAPVHLSNERDRRGGVRHARVRQPWKAGPQPRGLRLVRHEVRSSVSET